MDLPQDKLATLPSIRDVITSARIKANKALGQNFILDTDITDRIVAEAPSIDNKVVLEVGGGVGTLTRSLIASKAKKIFVIEKDNKCKEILDDLIPISNGRLEVLYADALEFDEDVIGKEKLHIIANLPYHIGTKLILKWINNSQNLKALLLCCKKMLSKD